jgi:shikimate dehydrogenase
MRVSAATRVAAVIGDPVAHSRSPDLHNAAFAAAGLDAVFVAWRVAPADLAAAVAGFRALGLLGASVTVPHKQAVAALCDRLAAPADTIGAVNCLAFERAGGGVRVIGHNTDAGGFVDSLRHDAAFEPAGCRAVLLGAGGAARAVHAGLVAAGVDRVAVVARRPDEAVWARAPQRAHSRVHPWTEASLAGVLPGCDLLVDCTSLGLDPAREAQAPAPVPVAALSDHTVVATLVYHREPALLGAARARGLRVVDGAGMLVHQGARAFALWTGQDAPIDAMWAAMRGAMAAGR